MELLGAQLRRFETLSFKIREGSESYPKYPNVVEIPLYQRPYTWQRANIRALFDDSYNDGSENYFAGSLVSVVNERDGKEYHSLVDGQQRFTTLYLTNFVRFLVARSVVEYELKTKLSRAFTDHCKNLATALKGLCYGESLLSELIEWEKSIPEELTEELQDEELKKFRALLGLPENSLSGSETYEDEYFESSNTFFSSQQFAMRYEQSTFNADLAQAFSSCFLRFSNEEFAKLVTPTILEIRLLRDDQEVVNSSEKIEASLSRVDKLLVAIREIYYNGNRRFPDNLSEKFTNPKEHLVQLFEVLTEFLERVQLSVIQTNTEDDAFTLFEVLNDRAMALDDLDLIKNSFYRRYTAESKTSSDSSKTVEETVAEADKIWAGEVFTGEAWRKKLVLGVGTAYLTGNTQLRSSDQRSMRKALQGYLNLTDQTQRYKGDCLLRDFRVFKAIKLILASTELTHQKSVQNALNSEYDSESHFLRTLKYLYARGQIGVMYGLLCFVLKKLETLSDDLQDQFKEDLIKEKIQEFVAGEDNSVEEVSLSIWKASIMAGDEALPRQLSDSLVASYCLTSNFQEPLPSAVTLDMVSAFQQNLQTFDYNGNTLAVRVLFARAIVRRFDNKTGKFYESPTLNPQTIQEEARDFELDHIEPQSPEVDTVKLETYYDDSDENLKNKLINGLGNMLPLRKRPNIQKRNNAYHLAKHVIDESYRGVHSVVFDSLDNIFEATKKTKTVTVTSTEEKKETELEVVTREFFLKREKALINIFTSLVTEQPIDKSVVFPATAED